MTKDTRNYKDIFLFITSQLITLTRVYFHAFRQFFFFFFFKFKIQRWIGFDHQLFDRHHGYQNNVVLRKCDIILLFHDYEICSFSFCKL